MLQMAMAADLLTIGLGNEFATQVTMIWYAETAPIGIRNMAKKRTPVFVVDMTIILPIQDTHMRHMM